jgi:hypothetical protein
MAVHRSFLRLLVRSVNTDLLTALGLCDFNDAMIPLRLQRSHGGWDEIWHFYMANYGGFCLVVVWLFSPRFVISHAQFSYHRTFSAEGQILEAAISASDARIDFYGRACNSVRGQKVLAGLSRPRYWCERYGMW